MKAPQPLRDRLAAGAKRGLGCVNAVVREVANESGAAALNSVAALIEALGDARPVVVERAANALKKVQAADPKLLHSFARPLLRAAATCEVMQARWNLTLVVGNLPLAGTEQAIATDLLLESLKSRSALLRVFALEALVKESEHDPALRERLRPVALVFLMQGTAAMSARARRLLPRLGGER